MRMLFLFAVSLAAQFAASIVAQAGDVAELEILGFTEDGGVFAFEEYGVQDGSGFPYANRYYIDTSNDSFLKGTPIRVRLDDENATLDAARLQVRQGEIVGEAELSANRGITAGFNPVTELSADPHRMVVNPRPIFSPVDQPLEFRLDEIGMNNTEGCESQGEINGFRLLRIEAQDGGTTKLLHETSRSPRAGVVRTATASARCRHSRWTASAPMRC